MIDYIEDVNKVAAVFDDLSQMKVIAIDTETNGLDCHKNQVVMASLGDSSIQYVFNLCKSEIREAFAYHLKDIAWKHTWLGANIKFDMKMIETNFGIKLDAIEHNNIFDIMVAEQRLYQNMKLSNSLVEITYRYLGFVPNEMDKRIRDEFIGCNINTFIPQQKHIDYSASDIKHLHFIMDKQQERIDKYNLNFLMEGIEFPLIGCLAHAEIRGIRFNNDTWLKVNKVKKDAKFEIECKMDEEVRRLRDTILANRPDLRMKLVGGKYDQPRLKHPSIVNQGLFGDPVTHKALTGNKIPVKTNKQNVNYGSTDEIKRLFALFSIPLSTEKGKYEIPVLNETKNKTGQIKEVIGNNYHNFTTEKEYLDQWLLRYANHHGYTFVKLLREHRDYVMKIATFGEKYAGKYINPVTGKIHTIFRQCTEDKGDQKKAEKADAPVNGRLSSGDSKNGHPNMQNIPREKEYRIAYVATEGYWMGTYDLSSAEVTTMAAKCQDKDLLKHVNNGTFHDFVATHAWRLILRRRNDPKWETFTVSKTENPNLRQIGKNMHFGIFYGLHDKKGAETLNIIKEEARVYINFLRNTFRKTANTLDGYAEEAIKKGFLIIDDRTNARIWFPKVVECIKANRQIFLNNQTRDGDNQLPYESLDFMDKIKAEGQARNIPISGTQANMIKEAMVDIYRYNRKHDLDAHILLQVHDELVPEVNKNIGDVLFTDDEGNSKMVPYKEFFALMMSRAANRYLKGDFRMLVDYHIGETWTK